MPPGVTTTLEAKAVQKCRLTKSYLSERSGLFVGRAALLAVLDPCPICQGITALPPALLTDFPDLMRHI